MNERMTFPNTWEEFEKHYGFTDNEEVYTNGARLIPSFRVKQLLDHLLSEEPQKWIPCSERLPSDHERCFLTEEVHYTTGRIIRRVLMAFYDDENDEWYEEMGEDVEVVSYPLAWMPLPKPYKEEKE